VSGEASGERTVLIAGGGTGGHVFPAIAVAREWLARPIDQAGSAVGKRSVVLVGTEQGMEAKLVPQAGLPLEVIRAAGLKGLHGRKFLRNAALLPAGLLDSRAILRRHRFVAAFGVGGYASGPMMLLASLYRLPTVVFEPNAQPGLTNRILARLATRIAVAYSDTAAEFGPRAVVTGCPIRREFFAIEPKPHAAPFTLLLTGGSRGAHPINMAVVGALDRFAEKKDQLFIVHQTGERDYNAVREEYARRAIHAEVVPFIDNMAERFAQADLIVCRSGAITVAEVSAAGRAAIFIPFGASTDAHQTRNAAAVAQAGAACLLPQDELTPDRLAGEVFSLLDQPRRIQQMESCARALARPRAVEDIVDLLERVAL
jgi:UDP-N-acetylglucosamine--N-acetylmuramyl-(pentapeptide) pyrophosphoryl-undecaprenol N-acetylglucosamine transferase